MTRLHPARGPAAISALLLVAFAAATLHGQQLQDRMRNLDSDRQSDLLYTEWRDLPEKHENFEYGAWTAVSFFDFENQSGVTTFPDPVQSAFVLDQRIWGRWDRDNGDSVYVRGRYLDIDQDLSAGVFPTTLHEEGLDLDLGYYDSPGQEVSWRLGRQYLALGRGLVLSQNLDAARLHYRHQQWAASLFWGRTPPKTTDRDPFVGASRRDWTGLHVEHFTESDHRLFAYYTQQDDRTSTAFAGQGMQYDSNYLAAGAEGPLAHDFRYYFEAIRQGGDSPTRFSATARSDIDAHAFQAEVIWRPDRRHHPTLSAGYLYGSGDPDRGSVVTSAAGNMAGTGDDAFIGFGRFEGGLALSPRLSNLGVLRLAGSYKFREAPVDHEVLQLQGMLSFYRKADAAGRISSIGATVIDDDIGVGADLILSWRPAHDFTVAIQGSRFEPGDAYPAATRTDSTALFANVTYSY